MAKSKSNIKLPPLFWTVVLHISGDAVYLAEGWSHRHYKIEKAPFCEGFQLLVDRPHLLAANGDERLANGVSLAEAKKLANKYEKQLQDAWFKGQTPRVV